MNFFKYFLHTCFTNNSEPAQSQRIYSQGSQEPITVMQRSGMFIWGKVYCPGGDRSGGRDFILLSRVLKRPPS